MNDKRALSFVKGGSTGIWIPAQLNEYRFPLRQFVLICG